MSSPLGALSATPVPPRLRRSDKTCVREQLYRKRALLQAQVQNDTPLDFRADTAHIRAAEWRVDPLPRSVLDRRVDIGDVPPSDAGRLFEALYSGASVR